MIHDLRSTISVDITFWEEYMKAAKSAALVEKDSFIYLVEFQSRIANKLYELLAVEPRPVEDAALGTAACFATTYIKEMVIVPLPDTIRAPLRELSRLSVERRAELLLTYLIHHELPDVGSANRFIIRVLAMPVATSCYSIARPDVPLRGPTGCKNIEMKPRKKLENGNKRKGCPDCGSQPLYVTKNGYVCSLCFSNWDDNLKHCLFCNGTLQLNDKLMNCAGCQTVIPYLPDEKFPKSLFSRFEVKEKRISYTLAEEWENLIKI